MLLGVCHYKSGHASKLRCLAYASIELNHIGFDCVQVKLRRYALLLQKTQLGRQLAGVTKRQCQHKCTINLTVNACFNTLQLPAAADGSCTLQMVCHGGRTGTFWLPLDSARICGAVEMLSV